MNLRLTAGDLARCETASRTLLSPHAFDSVDDWRSAVLQSLRELLHADQTLFMLSTADRVHYSDSLDAPVIRGYDQYLAGTDDSGVRLTDPVVERWLQVQATGSQSIFSNAEVDHLLAPYDLSLRQSPMFQEGMASAGVIDQRSMFISFRGGASMIQCGITPRNGAALGDGALALLRLLLPSYRAGVEATHAFTQRWTMLEAAPQPAAVFGNGQKELYRNPAFCRLLEAEPERDKLAVAISRVVAALYPLTLERPATSAEDVLPESIRTVTTTTATYILNGTLLAPGPFYERSAILVFIDRRGRLALPTAEALRARYGLTAREAEVALLLADGLSTADIAERLFLSFHTVRRHTENVFYKVGVNSRKALGLRFIADRGPC